MMKYAAACLFGLSVCSAFADVLTIKEGMSGKWNEASSYEENALPTSDDTVRIKTSTHVEANKADIDFLETTEVRGIVYETNMTTPLPTLTVTIGEGEETSFGGALTNTIASSAAYFGTLVKKGKGRLNLTIARANGLFLRESGFQVDDGVLCLPRVAYSYRNQWLCKIVVNKPGVLIPITGMDSKEDPRGSDNHDAATYVRNGFSGDGIISNSTPRRIILRPSSSSTSPVATFSGPIFGRISVRMTDSSYKQAFTGLQNGVTDSAIIGAGAELQLGSFGGTRGEHSNTGSLGTAAISVGTRTTMTYLGAGETSYATFSGSEDLRTLTLNGGPNGGFDHRGTVNFATASMTNAVTALILTGDHTNACTLGSCVKNGNTADKPQTTRLVKRGCGTWNVIEDAESTLNGTVAVEDGTLAASTLLGAGVLCSLGYADLCQEDYFSKTVDPTKNVDYAVLLGTASTTGTLAYVGTESAVVSGRKIALLGDGRLTSDSAALDWSGVTSVATNTRTIFVGGAADGSVVRDVADGEGGAKVKVVKEGTGDLTLAGTLDFSGGLEVKGGTLAISSATNYYQWYRVLFKERLDGPTTKADDMRFDIGRIGLFDAAGNWLCTNFMTNNLANGKAWLLAPGETAVTAADPHYDWSKYHRQNGSCIALFTNVNTTTFWRYSNKAGVASLENTNAWLGVALRLPAESATKVVSYDIGSRWSKNDTDDNKAGTPTSWSIYGSCDGVTWAELASVVSNELVASSQWCWRKATTSRYTTKTTDHWPIANGVAPETTLARGLDEIAVAAGAKVVTDKSVTVRKVTVDAAGSGAIEGFALDEDEGVIDIVNAPAKGVFQIAVDFSKMTIPEGVAFTVNGKADRREISLSADGRTLTGNPSGLMVIVK